MRITPILCLAGALVVSTFGCQKGGYTDDRRYSGNPERLPTAVESVAPHGVSSSGTKEPLPNDQFR
ncbi:MAG TPA: hypothetical protein VL329_07245 [Nitrospiraceae bacterium]|jgi:hypothetical protein|nr:hypothetical protein [Nitrospiraceae bacterium]